MLGHEGDFGTQPGKQVEPGDRLPGAVELDADGPAVGAFFGHGLGQNRNRGVQVVDGMEALDHRVVADIVGLDVAHDQERRPVPGHDQGLEDMVSGCPESREVADVLGRGDDQGVQALVRQTALHAVDAGGVLVFGEG